MFAKFQHQTFTCAYFSSVWHKLWRLRITRGEKQGKTNGVAIERVTFLDQYFHHFFFLHNSIVRMGFFPWDILVAFFEGSQLRQSRATQSTVHTGCFSVSRIHQTLTWTRGSLNCVSDLRACVYIHGTSVYRFVYSLIRTFVGYRVCIEFDSGETHTQSRARDGHPSMWWPRSVVLIHGFRERPPPHPLTATPTPGLRSCVQTVPGFASHDSKKNPSVIYLFIYLFCANFNRF